MKTSRSVLFYYHRGKKKYQKLPMLFYNVTNIFQEKTLKIFEGFDMIRAYINNILVITKQNFTDHLKHQEKLL